MQPIYFLREVERHVTLTTTIAHSSDEFESQLLPLAYQAYTDVSIKLKASQLPLH